MHGKYMLELLCGPLSLSHGIIHVDPPSLVHHVTILLKVLDICRKINITVYAYMKTTQHMTETMCTAFENVLCSFIFNNGNI